MIREDDIRAEFVITTEQKKSRYILSGRALVDGDDLAANLDDNGRVSVLAWKARLLILLFVSPHFATKDGDSWLAARCDGER